MTWNARGVSLVNETQRQHIAGAIMDTHVQILSAQELGHHKSALLAQLNGQFASVMGNTEASGEADGLWDCAILYSTPSWSVQASGSTLLSTSKGVVWAVLQSKGPTSSVRVLTYCVHAVHQEEADAEHLAFVHMPS